MKCRFCNTELHDVFLDLGFAPPSNAYISQGSILKPEIYYPLGLLTCGNCFLVQIDDCLLYTSDAADE